MAKINKIKGFADLLPMESGRMLFMENAAREIFGGYGYGELRTPVLEKTELFARGIGEETDVVMKEMYTFPDRKNRSLTMRPEATAGVMRAFIESNLRAKEQVSKLFTIGPMFRYERPQKGRMRQFHQINAECIGPVEPQADAEVILMLLAFLKRLGIKDLALEINSLGCRECRPEYHKALGAFFESLDEEKLCSDCRRRKDVNPLRVLDCKVPSCKELVEKAPAITDHLCEECAAHFEVVLSVLRDAGLEYVHNVRLVRGLDYYTRTTFEVVSGKIGAQSSVAGGGRYDGLIRDLGGPDVPGVGFACGMERLALLLPEQEERGLDFYLAPLVEEALAPAMQLARELRERGLSGIVSFSAKSLKSQMRQAGKQGASYCLLLGEEELDKNTIVIKNLGLGEQISLALDDVETIAEHMASAK